MRQVDSISVEELRQMAEKMYGSLVKAVVDVERRIVVVDAEMHADEEQFLLENGSEQKSLWGVNFYPAKFGTEDFIEFDSMINLRPRANNMSRGIEDPELRQRVRAIAEGVVHE